MTTNPYGLTEGSIESHTEYKPEALGNTEITAGEPEQTWEDYCIELVPVLVDGEDIGKRAIVRNGEFITWASDQYRLLPNEEAVAVANDVAEELGAVPFSDFGGDWYIKLDEHVFQDEDGRRAHALYAWDDPVDLYGTGDEIQLGFAVHNSIDKSMGFRVGLFTFRHACANMVFMGMSREGMSFDQRDVIEFSSRKHTLGLKTDHVKAYIEDTIQFGPTVIEAYQSWMNEPLSAETTLDLLQRAQRSYLSRREDLPPWMSTALAALQEAEEKAAENEQLSQQFEGGLPDRVRAGIVEAKIPEAETMWSTYNDLTANIWHNQNTGDQTKMQKMRHVHRSFPISTTTDGGVPVTIR